MSGSVMNEVPSPLTTLRYVTIELLHHDTGNM